MTAAQRFARAATGAVVRKPVLWKLLRGPVRRLFDRAAPRWNAIVGVEHLAPYEAALAAVEPPPARALDVGTGTGLGALAIARRWPHVHVLGIDVSEAMIDHAREALPRELRDRVSFAVADAAAVPEPDGAFDLVAHANAIPFFDEVARVLAPGGHAVFAFSRGNETPIHVPPARLRAHLQARGLGEFRELAAGRGTALVARKPLPR